MQARAAPSDLFALYLDFHTLGALRASSPYAFMDYVVYGTTCAFAGVLMAVLERYNHLVVGNERSANAGNLTLSDGSVLNHQYEKSFVFEQALHRYIREYLVEDLYYFSGLMSLWDIQIMEQFARLPAYRSAFLSCNMAGDLDRGLPVRNCGACPKWLAVYALLSASVPPAEVAAVFGGDLFARPALFPGFEELMELRGSKPLECVPTAEEVLLGLYLCRERFHRDDAFFLQYRRAIDQGSPYRSLLHDNPAPHLYPPWYRRIVHGA